MIPYRLVQATKLAVSEELEAGEASNLASQNRSTWTKGTIGVRCTQPQSHVVKDRSGQCCKMAIMRIHLKRIIY